MKKMNKQIKKIIIFDVDSTLVDFEGLDFLAELVGKSKELSKLTARAMNGELSMKESMDLKMAALKPSRVDLEKMGQEYVKRIVPGTVETITKLKEAGHEPWILTGNFQPAVGILAKSLGIPEQRVLTNEVYFDENANYLGYNSDHPLANNQGKALVIKNRFQDLENIIMVGDGATDLDTKPIVGLFIGFGGVVHRDLIAKSADIYIETKDLRMILPHIGVK